MHVVLETALDIARGMEYLHSNKVLHADLCSNNIMLDDAENERGFVAKLTDFGMSRFVGKGQTVSFGTVSHT